MKIRGGCVGCLARREPVRVDLSYLNGFMTCMALHAVDRRQVVAYVGELCLEHAGMAAGVLSVFAEANEIETTFLEVLERAHPETARKGSGS